MTGRLLDVSTMPFEQVWTCQDGFKINLGDFLDRHHDAIQTLATDGLIKANESFGFAMTVPMWADYGFNLELWDKPEEFVWFVGGWGPDRNRYIANAVRKMRALLRPVENVSTEIFSTLDIRFYASAHFQDKVASQNDDGTFSWGDFPWGGAVAMPMADFMLVGAVSALTEIEDDFITKLILGGIGKLIVEHDGLLSDD